MFRNYIKIAWRNLLRSKLYSFINISGLALGISCCVLIFLYVQDELSYDSYNEKAERIYRITSILKQEKDDHYAGTPPVAGPKIQSVFPEVEKVVRLSFAGPLAYNHQKFYKEMVVYADSTLFDVFTFPFVEGTSSKALSQPYSVVITERTAKKYFGSQSAIGKVITLADTINLTVSGVMKDVPINSHFNFDCIISRSTLVDINKGTPNWYADNEQQWIDFNSFTYLLLKKEVDPKVFEDKVNVLLNKETASYRKDVGMWVNVQVQPLRDIHLYSHLDYEFPESVNSDISYVYIFSATAFLILLIACCNFINLSTARSLNRSKEIGLRKVIGAQRLQLINQFFGESLMFSIIASILSLALVIVVLPYFNSYTGKHLEISVATIGLYVAVVVCVGILAGLYPAVLMSSFAPVRALKGKISHGLADIVFRKGLVVFQFAAAIILIIVTTVILQQLDFIQNKNIGLNKNQVLNIGLYGLDEEKAKVMVTKLSSNPNVLNSSLNNFSFNGVPNLTVWPQGFAENEKTGCPVIAIDDQFFKTMEIELLAGRNFSKDFPSDANEGFIVNETAVKEFRWKNAQEAIGKKITWEFDDVKRGKIIGVVKDFNFTSMKEHVKPMLMHIYPRWYGILTLRLKSGNVMSTMAGIESTWKSLAGDAPFDYMFLEDDFNSLYKSEQNMKSVLSVFTVLSILVACLGLFGLAAFTIKQRYREIGIRKVLGSGITNIVRVLSIDFLKLVLVSVLIACPIAWYIMHLWLMDFAFKVDVSWLVFVGAAILAMMIAFFTVAFQAYKAAAVNPIKSLKSE